MRGGGTGDVAVDHYHRWPRDVELMAELGLSTLPVLGVLAAGPAAGRGPVDPRGLDFYYRLVDGLLERGIEPC